MATAHTILFPGTLTCLAHGHSNEKPRGSTAFQTLNPWITNQNTLPLSYEGSLKVKGSNLIWHTTYQELKIKINVVCTQKNHLVKTIQISTHNIRLGRKLMNLECHHPLLSTALLTNISSWLSDSEIPIKLTI